MVGLMVQALDACHNWNHIFSFFFFSASLSAYPLLPPSLLPPPHQHTNTPTHHPSTPTTITHTTPTHQHTNTPTNPPTPPKLTHSPTHQYTDSHQHTHTRAHTHTCPIIIIIIKPLTARVVGAPQMILQPVFSIFPCSPLPSGTC